jgi:hypothetical protein
VRAGLVSTIATALIVLFTSVVLALAWRGGPSGCPTASGGETGVDAQLRYVDISERQVTFTFGPSAVSDSFGVPRFEIGTSTSATPPPELDTGTHRLAIAFTGASEFNPDLTPSYRGSSLLVPATPGVVREAVVTHDTGGQMSWAVVVNASTCPEVSTNTYVWGKSPRAQVTLTFSQGAWITAEHPATYVGGPILAPVLVAGRGFTPRAKIEVRVSGQLVESAEADGDGRVEVGIFVPKLQPGVYEISVSDTAGRRATSRLVVTDEL